MPTQQIGSILCAFGVALVSGRIVLHDVQLCAALTHSLSFTHTLALYISMRVYLYLVPSQMPYTSYEFGDFVKRTA